MNKNLSFFFALAVCLSLTGCAHEPSNLSPYTDVNTIEGVWIEVKPGTVSPTGVEVEFHNTTTERTNYFNGVTYGLGYCGVEERVDDSWHVLPCLDGVFSGNYGPDWGRYIYTQSELEQIFADASYDPDSGLPWDPDSELRWFRYPPNTMGYDWESEYGELPSGDYRIIVDVTTGSGETLTTYYLTAEFQIP